jgi:hypothetical protein
MKDLKIYKLIFLIWLLCIFGSCFTTNKRMTPKNYFDYLREDTTICELPTFDIEIPFKFVLDSINNAWENCVICKNEPYPFVFEINEIAFEDTLIYTIRTNASPKLAHNLYLGAFTYKGNVFVVLNKVLANSSFIYNEKNDPTNIFFCDRIYSSICGLKIEFKWNRNNSTFLKVECLDEPIIKIK